MGLFDNAKDLMGQAEKLAGEHNDEVGQGIDKLEDLADGATGGKYTDQIDSAGAKAGDYVDGLDGGDKK